MLGMHFLYDVNVVFGRQPGWHLKPGVHIWQQYICWSFILIAGFAFRWGRRRNIKRGLTLNLFGFLITAVTLLAVPQEAIYIQDNMPGIVVVNGDYKVFIPVNVLEKRDGLAYIAAIQQGVIYEGQTVQLFR